MLNRFHHCLRKTHLMFCRTCFVIFCMVIETSRQPFHRHWCLKKHNIMFKLIEFQTNHLHNMWMRNTTQFQIPETELYILSAQFQESETECVFANAVSVFISCFVQWENLVSDYWNRISALGVCMSWTTVCFWMCDLLFSVNMSDQMCRWSVWFL